MAKVEIPSPINGPRQFLDLQTSVVTDEVSAQCWSGDPVGQVNGGYTVPITGGICSSTFTAPRLWKFCPECAQKLEATWRYCSGCGNAIPTQPQWSYTTPVGTAAPVGGTVWISPQNIGATGMTGPQGPPGPAGATGAAGMNGLVR